MTIKSRNERETKALEIDLSGPQGNAYCLLGIASNLAQQLKLDWKKISKEMKSSDYDNLIEVFDKYFGDYVTLYR